jgi:hypothetical protein
MGVRGLLLFSLFALLPASCSLDEHPKDQIADELAHSTPESLFKNNIITLYNYVGGATDGQGLQGTCRGIYDLQTFGSDEAMLPTRGHDWYDGEMWQHMYRHSWDPGHELLYNSWTYLYKAITLCNRSIEHLAEHRDMLSDHDFQAYTAEVRALRAIYYWYLLDLFGRVPIFTNTSLSMNDVFQSERSELFKFVYDELLEACYNLPKKNSVGEGDYYGRVTFDVAMFVLAKLALNAEIYLDDDWTDKKYLDGKEIILDVYGQKMNAWEAVDFFCAFLEDWYRLEDYYSSNFVVRNENSRENIWIIPMDKDLYSNTQQNLKRSWHYRHADAYGITGENGSCATLNTLRIFGYGTEDEDPRFELNYWANEVYDRLGNFIPDRTGNPLTYYPNAVKMDLSYDPYVETAGARMKKYDIDKNATKDGTLMDNDIVLFRFADVLLMRAEAKWRNGQDGSDDFNAVRNRAGVEPREMTAETLLDERLLELCWEGWRRQDMIRFRQYKSLFTGDAFDDPIDESDGHTTVFPIPKDILILNPHFTQNKGY